MNNLNKQTLFASWTCCLFILTKYKCVQKLKSNERHKCTAATISNIKPAIPVQLFITLPHEQADAASWFRHCEQTGVKYLNVCNKTDN